MALNEIEQNIVKSIKEQGWSRDDVISILNKYRMKQKDQASKQFKGIEEEAQAGLENRVTPTSQLNWWEKEKWSIETIQTEWIWAWWEMFKEWIDNIVWWAISQTPEIVWDTAWFFANILWSEALKYSSPFSYWLNTLDKIAQKKGLPTLWEHLKQQWIETKEKMQEFFWVEADKMTTKIWEFWSEVAALMTPAWWYKITEKIIEKSPKLMKLAEEFPKLFAFLKSSIWWAEEMSKFWIVSEWDITWQDVLTWAVWWPVVDVIWKWLTSLWKKIYDSAYRPTKQEAEAIFYEMSWKLKNRKSTRAETAFDKNIAWTQTWIWVKWVKEAQKIWQKDIQPIIDKAQTQINKRNLFAKIQESINKTADPWRRADLQKGLDTLKKEWATTEYTTIQQWQNAKSEIDKFTPNKSFRWEEIWPSYREIKARFSNLIRWEIHDWLLKEFWVNTAKKYMEYANLRALQDIWVKGIQTWWDRILQTPWWTATLLSMAYWTIMTPIQTYWWLTLYKVWDLFTIVWPTWLKYFNDLVKDISNNE